ncbi:hypothetical protein C8J57DRAFT_1516603 [Mycena rebaudengoi]|nr:hypothetical protein C8J57DRAFT_1516603 [Mycena rebaudengoi]
MHTTQLSSRQPLPPPELPIPPNPGFFYLASTLYPPSTHPERKKLAPRYRASPGSPAAVNPLRCPRSSASVHRVPAAPPRRYVFRMPPHRWRTHTTRTSSCHPHHVGLDMPSRTPPPLRRGVEAARASVDTRAPISYRDPELICSFAAGLPIATPSRTRCWVPAHLIPRSHILARIAAHRPSHRTHHHNAVPAHLLLGKASPLRSSTIRVVHASHQPPNRCYHSSLEF